MIDNPFIKSLVIREFMDRFSPQPKGRRAYPLPERLKIYKDSIKKGSNNSRLASSLCISLHLHELIRNIMLGMLLCIVHLVKLSIQKNSLTSRTQLKSDTLTDQLHQLHHVRIMY